MGAGLVACVPSQAAKAGAEGTVIQGAATAVTQTAPVIPDGPKMPTKPQGAVRLMVYNLEWWNDQVSPERVQNLKRIFDDIQPDVVAFAEVQNLASLRKFLGDEWQIAMEDAEDEAQETAVAVRKPLQLKAFRLLFPDPRRDFAFPGRRDVMESTVETPSGEVLRVYSNHWKSRRGGRLQTDPQRIAAAEYTAAYLLKNRIENAVFMGDLNDTPDDQSLQILESGDSKAKGGSPDRHRVLVNLMEGLYDRDGVTIGLAELYRGQPVAPFVAGAKADSERLRGVDYRFPQDVRVTQTLFDQILVSPPLAKRVKGDPIIYANPVALAGTRSRVQVTDAGVQYTQQGSRVSDHLPVFVDLLPAR